ncbi:MAG: acylphosphatase [Solobacterium sp.]|nr:acylphosphatase [Solobacterium sp.]
MKKVIRRRRYVFFGEVQGVGFRYTAIWAARNAGASGWVRNDPEGTVTMEIQGDEEQIRYVLDAIERGTYIHVTRMDVKELPLDEHESVFEPVF